MKDSPIVGVLAAATRDHLLIDALFHITLCGKSPKGRVLIEVRGFHLNDIMELKEWKESTRQCSWCVKKLAKRQADAK